MKPNEIRIRVFVLRWLETVNTLSHSGRFRFAHFQIPSTHPYLLSLRWARLFLRETLCHLSVHDGTNVVENNGRSMWGNLRFHPHLSTLSGLRLPALSSLCLSCSISDLWWDLSSVGWARFHASLLPFQYFGEMEFAGNSRARCRCPCLQYCMGSTRAISLKLKG